MPLRDEQIVIISPGSQVTLAQLGIQESISPASLRIRSCMFPAENQGEWEPYKVREKPAAPKKASQDDTENNEGAANPNDEKVENPDNQDTDKEKEKEKEKEIEYYEDYQSEEDAIWPLKEGKIVNWSAFFALLSYVHKRLSPHLHSPVLLVAQPCWTVKDYEKLTQFYFEQFKPPGFVIVDSALTSLWAYNVVNACVVDVGFEKADITAVVDFSVSVSGRGVAIPHLGGEAFTQNLLQQLESLGFNRDQADQLKKSSICEILPKGAALPGTEEPVNEPETETVDPPPPALIGVNGGTLGNNLQGSLGEVPLGPGPGTVVGEEKSGLESEGVLDVAGIVAGGNKRMEEFLAKKEKEKQGKKAKGDVIPAAQKPIKLRNSERQLASFTYEEIVPLDLDSNGTGAKRAGVVKKDIRVGTERFQAAGETIDKIADAVYLAVSSVDDASKRSEVWDHLIVVGNGAKIRGFHEELMASIQRKFIISPSSATIFTSEIPSHVTTPSGTGTNTPQPQFYSHQQPQQQQFMQSGGPSSSVNPLLVAAVTSQTQQFAAPGQLTPAHSTNLHSAHGQTPTSCNFVKHGDYFPEWRDVGFDEAHFLGAQVMAKVLFVVDQGNSKGFMNRSDYNELGPSGITEFGP